MRFSVFLLTLDPGLTQCTVDLEYGGPLASAAGGLSFGSLYFLLVILNYVLVVQVNVDEVGERVVAADV